jgi:PiT family inorganic phosphate transporter
LKKARKRKLVRRRHLVSIVAAWLVTVPISAALAAAIYFGLASLK